MGRELGADWTRRKGSGALLSLVIIFTSLSLYYFSVSAWPLKLQTHGITSGSKNKYDLRAKF